MFDFKNQKSKTAASSDYLRYIFRIYKNHHLPMTKVISFANHKGGVGKTTLAVSISDALSREGFDVLLIDLDPQGNATRLVYSFDDTQASDH